MGQVRRSRFGRRLAALPALGLLVTSLWLTGPLPSVAAAPAKPEPGSPTSGDSLFPDIGNGGYDVAHYGIKLTYSRAGGTITATTTIKARAARPLTWYTLDLEGLTVRSVRVDGRRAAWSRSGHKLKITPARAVRGTFTTKIG